MAGGICLPPETVDAFKRALVSGKINPERLANMSSKERHELFKDVVGEGNAKFVNSKFETKLLLKNKQQGYLTWAKKLTGVTPEIRRDLITRIEKMDDRILDPAEEKVFLRDLASTRLGVDVTSKEAKQIANMSNKLQELEAKRKPDGTFPTEDDRMAYGRAKVGFGAHLAEMQNKAAKLSPTEALTQHPFDTASKAAGFAKALKASLDNSAIFRQGWKTLWTNPIKWQNNARKSFIDIAKQLGGKDTLKEVQADIVSRPNADLYRKMKLAIGNVEEEFPTTLPEKIPIAGRVYKASEGAYTGFLYRQRADIADGLIDIAKKANVNLNDKKELESIGKLVNSLTGRGDLGRLEGGAANTLNNIFFSARFLKSNIDLLTAHQLQRNVTPFVRKQAALNLMKVIAGTTVVLGVANAVKPGSVEWDPHSSNFGKIRIGHTTFDVSGGSGSIATLAARLAPLLVGKDSYTKSATTGVKSKINDGFGSTSGMDVFNDFFEGKLAPASSVVRDMLNQQDFNGNKPTATNEAKNALLPFPVTNATQTHDKYAANKLLSSIADGLGIATSTYTPQRKQTTLSSTQQAFKSKVGDKKFTEANDAYNKQYNEWLFAHQKQLNKLPPDEQTSTLTAVKGKIQKNIYKQYGFKAPKKSKPSAGKKTLLDSLK